MVAALVEVVAESLAAGFGVLLVTAFEAVGAFALDLVDVLAGVASATLRTPVSLVNLAERTCLIALVCSPNVIRNSWWPS